MRVGGTLRSSPHSLLVKGRLNRLPAVRGPGHHERDDLPIQRTKPKGRGAGGNTDPTEGEVLTDLAKTVWPRRHAKATSRPRRRPPPNVGYAGLP